MPKDVYKFNPSLASPETLQKTFVGRNGELERILRKIKECGEGASLRHFLLVGPRGIGKTHFILLIYYIVKGELSLNGKFKDLNQLWVPIRVAEDEYRISNLGEFLGRILQELKEYHPDIGKEPIPSEFKALGALHQLETEKFLRQLLESRQRLGQRFLLLVDNLREILERFTDEDQGRLRDILMSKDLFLLVGTAPTLFEDVISYERPFYNFFENIWLDELKTKEGTQLICKWWELDERNGYLDHLEAYQPKLNALMHLTGGNPRLLLSLYSIVTEAAIIEVEKTFIVLLDELTPYFQSIMKDFSPQQRKILDAMALAEGPSSPTEIAKEANLEVDVVTSQLTRLVRSRYVKPLKAKGKKETLYDVKERLFRLWRQMRAEAGRKHLSFIVTIIKTWYTEEELADQFAEAEQELDVALARKEKSRIMELLRHLWYLQEASPSYLSSKISSTRLYGLIKVQDFETAGEEIQRLLDRAKDEQNKDALAEAYELEAFYRRSKGEKEEAIEALERYLELKPNEEIPWYNLGVTYSELERYPEAIEANRKAIEITPDFQEAWYNLGRALQDLEQYKDAIEAYKKATEMKPVEYDSRYEAQCNMGAVYNDLGCYQDAITAERKAIKINPNRHEAWANLGWAYYKTSRYREAIKAYQKVTKIEPSLSLGWRHLGEALVLEGRNKEALEACQKGLEINSDEPELWDVLGHVYFHLGNYHKSIEACNRAIELSPSDYWFYLHRSYAWEEIGKTVKALKDLERAFKLAKEAEEEAIMEYTAKRIINLNLLCSEKRVSQGELKIGEKYFSTGLSYAPFLTSEEFSESLTLYFSGLLKKKRVEFLSRALKALEGQKDLPDLRELIRFYRIALAFLETKDHTLLNRLFPELRELVETLE